MKVNKTFKQCDLLKLCDILLNQPWHEKCEIIPEYIHPNANPKNVAPKVVIIFNDETLYPPFLRFSKGPNQGYFWDVYGDDFQTLELAIVALSKAPAPINVNPITFQLSFDKKLLFKEGELK